MKPVNYIFVPFMALSLSANAEVFKCQQASGKIIYQTALCSSGAAVQKVIKVDAMTPEQAEEARVKLERWKQQQAVDEAARFEAEKQRQTELEKQESLELQWRSVIAQEKQAVAEEQRQNQPIIIAPVYGGGRYWNNGGFPHQGPHDPNKMPHHPKHHQQPSQSPPNPSPISINAPKETGDRKFGFR